MGGKPRRALITALTHRGAGRLPRPPGADRVTNSECRWLPQAQARSRTMPLAGSQAEGHVRRMPAAPRAMLHIQGL